MDIGTQFSLSESLGGEELQDRWDLAIGDKIRWLGSVDARSYSGTKSDAARSRDRAHKPRKFMPPKRVVRIYANSLPTDATYFHPHPARTSGPCHPERG